MNIQKTIENKRLVLAIDGRLDTITAPVLDAEIRQNIDGICELLLDFKKLEYISSAGLRVLLGAQKIMNQQGSMTLCHVNSSVKEIFDLTGFSDILHII